MAPNITEAGTYLKRRLEMQDTQHKVQRVNPDLPFDNGSVTYTPEIIPIGIDTITSEGVTWTGETAEFDDDAGNTPMVEVAINEGNYKVYYRKVGARWSFMDLNKERIARGNGQVLTDIVGTKLKGISALLSEYGSRTCAYGHPDKNYAGLLNQPNVPINNSSFNIDTATVNDFVDFLNDEITDVCDQTNLAADPNVVYVPKRFLTKIGQQYPNDNISIKKAVLEAHPNIVGFIPYNEGRPDQLEEHLPNLYPAGGNRGLIWIQRLDPEAHKRLKSVRYMLPVDYRQGMFEQVVIQGFAVPHYMQPLTAKYVTYLQN